MLVLIGGLVSFGIVREDPYYNLGGYYVDQIFKPNLAIEAKFIIWQISRYQ
jgi:hypothetical protein